MIRVLIADDHEIVRRGLKQILSEDSEISVVGEFSDGFELLEALDGQVCDLLILDISMPGMGGIEALSRIKTEYPRLPVLFLSIYPEEQYAIRVLKDGASGYMSKECAPEELIKAVKKIHGGRRYISEDLAEQLAFYVESGAADSPHEMLSDREYAVFGFIAKGRVNKQIADELHLSTKTISTYRSRILDKMNMRTNADLIRYAVTRKLV